MGSDESGTGAWHSAELGVPGVGAATTTRAGGVSEPPFDTFNLATHVGDVDSAVASNRALLMDELLQRGCHAVQWLDQHHGNRCVRVAAPTPLRPPPRADAAWTGVCGMGLAALTADCLPVVLCRLDGTAVAVAHAGWRGLVAGVLPATVRAMPGANRDLIAWLGPAIGGPRYEVGVDVRDAVIGAGAAAERALSPAPKPGKYQFDLAAFARVILLELGVARVLGGGPCCAADERFYSYRRDGITGRMATIVWRQDA